MIFNTEGGSVFIPKKKLAEMGVSNNMSGVQGIITSPPEEKKIMNDNASDPCHGKPKELFIYGYDTF